LIKDTLVVVEAEVNFDDYSGTLKAVARNVLSLVEARSHYAKALEIVIDQACGAGFERRLKQFFTDHKGQTPISIQYERAERPPEYP
jgi:DNA polymerase-3 subunit alpha